MTLETRVEEVLDEVTALVEAETQVSRLVPLVLAQIGLNNALQNIRIALRAESEPDDA